jgi:prophage regulatory protein
MEANTLIRIKDLIKIIPISRASIWRLSRAGKFPRPIRLAVRTTAWRKSEIEAWLREREAAA